MKSIFNRRHFIVTMETGLTAMQVIPSFAFINKGKKTYLPLIRLNIGFTLLSQSLRTGGGKIFIIQSM